MGADLVYVVHSEPAVAEKLSSGLQAADYQVVTLTTVDEASSLSSERQFELPDAILTPLGDLESGDSVLIALFLSNPLMEQIPLVVVASSEKEERRRALRLGLLSVVFPPYDGEEVVLTTKLAIEKHRSDQLLFGSLAQLSVPDLLQTAEAGHRSGTVTFQHNGDKGTVWMRDGFVIDAEVENQLRGEEAVYAIAIWDTGTFEANFGPVDVSEQFRIPPSTLLLEAMRRFDEESAATMMAPEFEEPDMAAWDLALMVLNVVTSYALNHLDPGLVHERTEDLRIGLVDEHEPLRAFYVTEEGAVTLTDASVSELSDQSLVDAVGLWVGAIFDNLDEALAWRFTRRRLGQLLAPWRDKLEDYGFLAALGIDETGEDRDEEIHGPPAGTGGAPVPVGCLVFGGDEFVETYSAFGPRVGPVDPKVVIGKTLEDVLPPDLARLACRLRDQVIQRENQIGGLAVGREILSAGHLEHLVRIAVIRTASRAGLIVVINRLRDQRRALTPEIERDPVTGSLRDGKADRLLVANEDFLQAFEGLFARSLSHRHHELLQRFGKKWGLRHAVRLEQMVQRDYRMTLREMESQMALELLSSSIGVFGLGKFEADLSYRDNGLVIISHQWSPFPGIFSGSAGTSCSILSGFHAAILSYLAGRQLAAREVRCGQHPDEPCLFVIATEDRLTKLLIATPGSPDYELLGEIRGRAESGGQDEA